MRERLIESSTNSEAAGKSPRQVSVSNAIERLKSLHDGDRVFSEVVAFGIEAVPELRALLFKREPSGLYVARRRAVEALAALNSFDTLGEFLRLNREIEDPVERVGEEVVISAAARLIAQLHEDWVFNLLLDTAERYVLSGVLAGLGEFKRPGSIPLLIRALSEDDVRPTAEAVLRSFGRAARPHLIRAANPPKDRVQPESETNLRARRSAIRVLLDIGVTRRDWPLLRPLMQDEDLRIAILACMACAGVGTAADRLDAAARLALLRSRGDWLQRQQIDEIAERLAAMRSAKRGGAVDGN
jgi:HEAT repeat protein